MNLKALVFEARCERCNKTLVQVSNAQPMTLLFHAQKLFTHLTAKKPCGIGPQQITIIVKPAA